MTKGFLHHINLIIIAIICMFMIYSSMMKLVGFEGMEESFLVWGYSKNMMIGIGIIELVLAFVIFAKPTRVYGLIGLLVLLSGALYTHIYYQEYEEVYTAIFLVTSSLISLILIFVGDRLEG